MGIFDFFGRTEIKEEYYPNGKLKNQSTYKSGKKHGKEAGYHENGELQFECEWKKGLQNREVISYDKNGNKLKKSFLIDGIYEGPQKEWWPNGQLKADRIIKNDKIISEKKYDANGKSLLVSVAKNRKVDNSDPNQLTPKSYKTKEDLIGLDKDQKMIALVFFPKLKGIDFGDISLNIKGKSPQEFLTADVDGKWYFTSSNMPILFKAFSEKTFDQSLKKLLKNNNIELQNESKINDIRVWHADRFKIEHPPMINNINVIIITNEEIMHVDAMSLKETNLSPKISLPKECEIVGVKHIYDGNKTVKKSKNIIEDLTNVPLLFKDEQYDTYFILIANASLNPSKQIIDSIVKQNGGKDNFNFSAKIDSSWEHIYEGTNFVIGYLNQHKTIRINFLKKIQ